VVDDSSVQLADGKRLSLAGRGLALPPGRPCRVGIRCHDVHVQPGTDSTAEATLRCTLGLAELSGSATYLHLRHGSERLVAQLQGVHGFDIGSQHPGCATVSVRW